MRPLVILRRFLMPSPVVTLLAYMRYGALLSMRAEVELSPLLTLGRKVKISSFSKIKANHGKLEIGENTCIATGCFISAGEKGTRIGRDCLIGPNCTIVSSTYRYNSLDVIFGKQGYDSKGTRIGDNVLIYAGTVIVDGARIGNGVIIAANSVVAGDIPDNSVVQGSPGKVIFTRR